MSAQRRKYLLIAGGVVVIVIATVAALLLFDINKFKSKIESATFAATGLDFRIKGKLGFSFSPFGLSAKDIHVANKNGEILSLENLKLGLKLMPLLKKQIELTGCELVKPAVTIVKDTEGRYNFEKTEKKSMEWKLKADGLNVLKLSHGELVYLDKKTGRKIELKDFNLTIKDLSIGNTSGDIIKSVSFTGNLDCKEVRYKEARRGDITIGDVKSPIRMEKEVIHLTPLTMEIFGARGEGDATADKSEANVVYKINLKVPKLDFEKLGRSFGAQKKVIGGKGDLYASLTMKEQGSRHLLSSIDGTVSLRGDNLVIYIMDLDKVLSTYGTTQELNLVDLSAFLIAGPPSNIALKDLYSRSWEGKGIITHLISNWTISGGVAHATDSAFATHHNRVALKGKLDLVRERYDSVIVALLDDKGCAKFKQSISGPIDNPQISTVSAVASLAGPLINLYTKAKRIVKGGKCEVFYNGSVQQPPK